MPQFKPYLQGQVQLLPPSLDEIISQDHLARLINHAIDSMDFRVVENSYSLNGQHAYHPKMLAKVLIYGYATGTRSSRKLADKLHEDIVFMWLSGRQTPDFRTISDFRKDRLGDIKKLFEQVVEICLNLGMIRIGTVSIDGTTLRANANKNKMLYRRVLEKRKARIKQQIDEILQEAEDLDKKEDEIYGDLTPHTTGKPLTDKVKQSIERQINQHNRKQLNKITRRKQTLNREKKILQAKQQDIQGKLRKMRKDRNSMSATDKDATMCMMKEQYPAPGYNAQLATEHQVILAYKLFSDRNDSRLMKPMIKEVQERTKRKPETVLADAGYGNKQTYRFLKQQRITGFIPYNNYKQEMILRNKGLYQLPKNYDLELERYKLWQRLRLKSELGKKLIQRRRQDIEPVIGNIKHNLQFRRFSLKQKWKCEIELGLVCIAHNLQKIQKRIQRIEKLGEYGAELQRVWQSGQILGYVPVSN
jgi:transposase